MQLAKTEEIIGLVSSLSRAYYTGKEMISVTYVDQSNYHYV